MTDSRMTDNSVTDNPMGTDGFEFIEFAAPEPEQLRLLFERFGFPATHHHRSKNVTLHRQGDIHFLINAEPDSFAQRFARRHGPCVCAMAFRVRDAAAALDRARAAGAQVVQQAVRPMELNIPAIEGIGGSRLYLVDRYGARTIYDVDFMPIAPTRPVAGTGLVGIDHVTHNVRRGQLRRWADFYRKLFNFQEIRQFDIRGRMTGLVSLALASPCGRIRIPINESADDQSQIEEYLREYHGEGIQHIALATEDICATVDGLRGNGIHFQATPDTYYEALDSRLPGHGENVSALRQRHILLDGGEAQGGGYLLQIFTERAIGPIFFEIIQRKGNQGFGEGNFQALFESIELDQLRRGVLSPESYGNR